ncbi:hypothetical protein AWE51_09330 [Aquimarina aggregata]|uniref:Uncharacterized protein n=1 Tax=Aquimarina aggregata TaxID=1642818 RepID=A0A162ZJ95_9FLAO|nr:hypothetical protein [Aquimarina aggregata]KZS39839.1 hypothetical protein AWE51_09330 [Aquimarina aggregata]
MKSLLLSLLIIPFLVNGQSIPIDQKTHNEVNKKYQFYISTRYSQIQYNKELQIDEPVDSIVIDTVGSLSINEFKQKYPKLDSIKFSSKEAIAYKWFSLVYVKKWKETPVSFMRSVAKKRRIYEKIDNLLLNWKKVEQNYENQVGIELKLDRDIKYISYYIFDTINKTLVQYDTLGDTSKTAYVHLNKDKQFLLIVFDIQEDEMFYARRYINSHEDQEIQLSFKEVKIDELEYCFKIH